MLNTWQKDHESLLLNKNHVIKEISVARAFDVLRIPDCRLYHIPSALQPLL